MIVLNIDADQITGDCNRVSIVVERISYIEWGTMLIGPNGVNIVPCHVVNLVDGEQFIFYADSDSGKGLAEWFANGSFPTNNSKIYNVTEDYVKRNWKGQTNES